MRTHVMDTEEDDELLASMKDALASGSAERKEVDAALKEMRGQFAVIYHFEVHKGREQEFEQAWKQVTELIYIHEGSFGSRLHRAEGQLYVAYALWPDKVTWENSGANLPPTSAPLRQTMRDCCASISTVHTLDVVEDLLKDALFGK